MMITLIAEFSLYMYINSLTIVIAVEMYIIYYILVCMVAI